MANQEFKKSIKWQERSWGFEVKTENYSVSIERRPY